MYHEVGLLDHMVLLFLIFEDASCWFSPHSGSKCALLVSERVYDVITLTFKKMFDEIHSEAICIGAFLCREILNY